MTIGIDTSGSVCSVACIEGERLICEFSVNNNKTHSEALVPMLGEMLEKAGLSVSDCDLVAVAKGPGSFTGLRIGAGTAKGLAFALGIPIVGVLTLDGLAYNLYGSSDIVCPIMDARRKEVYTAAYRFDGSKEPSGSYIIEPQAIPLSDLLEMLSRFDYSVIFLGDGVAVYGQTIDESAGFKYHYAPAHLNMQKASSVAALGERIYRKNGARASLVMEYLRRPQAERERLGL